ncbi:cupin domain-containing protein [Asticcacaulis benevestitus]|uniref:(S)-ureidoglycine aminohydrolase cupin domain-containing protein n=1 Tax=Asticcacaulis benevestitus DSM 16100 = ATCC BAA-896 TaxID=1121022 RepID=V4PD29_9CAUL|nr:cupin domain-containing protein [Asticcacaulis benevestitus]ESQ83195.1 hypothetical protein ABENE_20450 [Asticcacaulis benevestitus DSM 16100 = ATCC BAA-896]
MYFQSFDPSTLPEPLIGGPPPERLVHGTPVFKTWILDTPDDKTTAGLWASTPGAWRVAYDEWEFCTLLEGRAVVTEDGEPGVSVQAGDHLVFRPGYRGVWEVIDTVLKTFVAID